MIVPFKRVRYKPVMVSRAQSITVFFELYVVTGMSLRNFPHPSILTGVKFSYPSVTFLTRQILVHEIVVINLTYLQV